MSRVKQNSQNSGGQYGKHLTLCALPCQLELEGFCLATIPVIRHHRFQKFKFIN